MIKGVVIVIKWVVMIISENVLSSGYFIFYSRITTGHLNQVSTYFEQTIRPYHNQGLCIVQISLAYSIDNQGIVLSYRKDLHKVVSKEKDC